jgi:hypothetical protein
MPNQTEFTSKSILSKPHLYNLTISVHPQKITDFETKLRYFTFIKTRVHTVVILLTLFPWYKALKVSYAFIREYFWSRPTEASFKLSLQSPTDKTYYNPSVFCVKRDFFHQPNRLHHSSSFLLPGYLTAMPAVRTTAIPAWNLRSSGLLRCKYWYNLPTF